MIVFLVPLKSKEVSQSWPLTSKLFERCIRSICSQIDNNYKVVIVCNDKPDISFYHSNIEYVTVNSAVPRTYDEKELDKGSKVIAGLLYSQKFSADHVMIVDADDCVSNRISQFVNQHPDSNGWVLKKGYIYKENSLLMHYESSRFHHLCGSCNILRFNLCPLPDNKISLLDQLAYFYSGRNHRNICNFFEEKGYALEILPFAGAIYIVGNGENIYQSSFSKLNGSHHGKLLFHIKQARKFRPILPTTKNRFGLYKIQD